MTTYGHKNCCTWSGDQLQWGTICDVTLHITFDVGSDEKQAIYWSNECLMCQVMGRISSLQYLIDSSILGKFVKFVDTQVLCNTVDIRANQPTSDIYSRDPFLLLSTNITSVHYTIFLITHGVQNCSK